jgi:hypothetical protein
MEDVWDMCPYCHRTGFQTLGGAQFAKTRLDAGSRMVSETQSKLDQRRTMLLSERRRQPVVGWLVAMNGEQTGEDFRLHEGQNTIGAAADCPISLKDATVTARHASVRCENGRFFLTDLDSTNGTYLNDAKDRIIREELKDNDVIRIGDISLKFKCL